MTSTPAPTASVRPAQPVAAEPARDAARSGRFVTLTVGIALALAACNLPGWYRSNPGLGVLITAAAVAGAVWGAPAVSERPVAVSMLWTARAARHRNTLFAAACTVAAAIGGPPAALSAVDALLLLTYLLAVDAVAAGPIGARQLRQLAPVAAALVATAVTWAAAWLPVDSSGVAGRIAGAFGVTAAALAAGSSFLLKRRR